MFFKVGSLALWLLYICLEFKFSMFSLAFWLSGSLALHKSFPFHILFHVWLSGFWTCFFTSCNFEIALCLGSLAPWLLNCFLNIDFFIFGSLALWLLNTSWLRILFVLLSGFMSFRLLNCSLHTFFMVGSLALWLLNICLDFKFF